jgi:hypothetical protein
MVCSPVAGPTARVMSCSPHWGRFFTQRSLARPKLRPLCATPDATLARVDSRLDTRCIAVGCVAGHVPRATQRSRLPSKMSEGRNGPDAGQSLPRRHRRFDRALAAARRLVNKSSDRLYRASPLRARPCADCGEELLPGSEPLRPWDILDRRRELRVEQGM